MKYQYKIIVTDSLDEELLNELGQDEWDLVFANYSNTTGEYAIILKRDDWESSPYHTPPGGVGVSSRGLRGQWPAWVEPGTLLK